MIKLHINDLLQSIQEAYASLIGLPVFIIDSAQTSLTSISNMDEFSKLMILSESREIQNIILKNWKTYLQLTSPAMIDVTFEGIKGLIAPVVVEGQAQCLIWAGPFVIEGGKEKIKKKLGIERGWGDAIQTAREYSLLDIQTKLHIMKEMASVCARLIEGEQKQERHLEQLRLLHRMIEIESLQTCRIRSYLHMFRQLYPSVHMVAYARKENEQHFIICDVSSEEADLRWLGAVYTTENPMIKRLFQENRPLYLENVLTKLQFADWVNKDNELKTLFLYPIKQDGQTLGVIFVGSKEKIRFSEEVKEAGYLLAKLIELFLCYKQSLYNKQQFLRLKTLNKINELISMKKSVNEILQMIADLSLDLVNGEHSIIFLQEYNEQKIFTNSKNFYCKYLHHYRRSLWKRYFDKRQDNFSMSLNYNETSRGIMIECPFYVNEHIRGVLTVHVAQKDMMEEREVSLSVLATFITIFLRASIRYNKEKTLVINQKFFSEILTPREMDVLKYIVEGYSNREIAEKLYISVHTVKNHITNIFQKLGVTDRSQLIAMVYRLCSGKSNTNMLN